MSTQKPPADPTDAKRPAMFEVAQALEDLVDFSAGAYLAVVGADQFDSVDNYAPRAVVREVRDKAEEASKLFHEVWADQKNLGEAKP